MRAQFPILDGKTTIEENAGRIVDPVERLRFLRGEMARRTKIPGAPKGIARRSRHWGWLVLPFAVILAGGPTPKSAADTFARERGLLVPRADAPNAEPMLVRRVWRIERFDTTEVYSNGLRVDLAYTISNRPRAAFPVYALAGASAPAKTGKSPVGIVYHTTESHLAPFEEEQNRTLKRLGHNLLEVIRQEHAYHYVIDRFGRVFAVVAESDAAFHAGNSVWADADGIYVNLNDSFIAVAFEGQTGASEEVTPAQIQSAKVLTEMLRSRYGIAAEDCVTHAQISINPLNMRVGNHTDWASKFPFAALGLPDNYGIPLASVYAFGFQYDGVYLDAIGPASKGLFLALEQVDKQAAAEHTPVAQYRAMLRHRYKDIAAALKKESEGGL